MLPEVCRRRMPRSYIGAKTGAHRTALRSEGTSPQRHTAVPSQLPVDCTEALPIVLAHPWSGEAKYFTKLLSDIAEHTAPGFGVAPCWNCSSFLSFGPAKYPAAVLMLESYLQAERKVVAEVIKNHGANTPRNREEGQRKQ